MIEKELLQVVEMVGDIAKAGHQQATLCESIMEVLEGALKSVKEDRRKKAKALEELAKLKENLDALNAKMDKHGLTGLEKGPADEIADILEANQEDAKKEKIADWLRSIVRGEEN